MFPVCTGINRQNATDTWLDVDVPCMHRDKPQYPYELNSLYECSLYAQG